MSYVLKHHTAPSFKSVYKWRVYRLWDRNGRPRTTQLAKFKNEAPARAYLKTLQATGFKKDADNAEH
jgi:hypothetical protein